MRGACTPEKKAQISEKAGVVASWLLHHDRYLRQYYSECYKRDVQVCNLLNKIFV